MAVRKSLLSSYLRDSLPSRHHLDVYYEWVDSIAHQTLESFKICLTDQRVITFDNLRICPPQYRYINVNIPLTPQYARRCSMSYSSDWYIDVNIWSPEGVLQEKQEHVSIASIPTMVRSSKCHLYGKTDYERSILGEDPADPGGYFIVEGHEYLILLQEQLVVNKVLIMELEPGNPTAKLTVDTVIGTMFTDLCYDSKTKVLKFLLPIQRNTPQDNREKAINVLCLYRLHGYGDLDVIMEMIGQFIP